MEVELEHSPESQEGLKPVDGVVYFQQRLPLLPESQEGLKRMNLSTSSFGASVIPPESQEGLKLEGTWRWLTGPRCPVDGQNLKKG